MQNKSMDFIMNRVHRGGVFFSALCSQAGAVVLLGPDNVTDLKDGPFGLELHYRCHCGETGVVYPQVDAAA